MIKLNFLDDAHTSAFTPRAVPVGRLLELMRGLDMHAHADVGWDAPAMLYGVAHRQGEDGEFLIAVPVLGDGDQGQLIAAQAVPMNLSALVARAEGNARLVELGGQVCEVRFHVGVTRLGGCATVYRDRRTERQCVDLEGGPVAEMLSRKLLCDSRPPEGIFRRS